MGEFRNRLIEAMDVCGITQAELAEKTGLSKPRINQYVNGIYEAKQDALFKLSKALNVDVAWLMGYDVPMETASDPNLAEQEKEFVELFLRLPADKKSLIIQIMKSYIE